MAEKKQIIIVGAGFAGIMAAKRLAKRLPAHFSLLLVDRRRHQLYTPALYEIASMPREVTSDDRLRSSILFPIDQMVNNMPVTFICDELIGLDASRKKIILKQQGELCYEYLILALGSETAYFDIPGLREHAFPLKTFDDAIRMRNAIEDLLKTKREIHISVGGAGSAGIELVAEFVNFMCLMQEKLVPKDKICSVFFTLIEAAQEILPGFEPWIVALTKKRLQHLGITIKTNKTIISVSEQETVFSNGEKQPCDILIWTGGVKGPGLTRALGLKISPKDSLLVDQYLCIKDSDGAIFAIGDNATFIHAGTKKPLVWNIPAAEQEAKIVTTNILRSIAAKPLIPFMPAKKYPFILAVGEKYAIADLIIVRFWGLSGWIAKQLVEFRYILSVLPFRNAVMFCWRSISISKAND